MQLSINMTLTIGIPNRTWESASQRKTRKYWSGNSQRLETKQHIKWTTERLNRHQSWPHEDGLTTQRGKEHTAADSTEKKSSWSYSVILLPVHKALSLLNFVENIEICSSLRVGLLSCFPWSFQCIFQVRINDPWRTTSKCAIFLLRISIFFA